jgi:hypothetical protein
VDPAAGRWDAPVARRSAVAVGIAIALAAAAIYLVTRTDRFYDHFVWQASAYLEGQVAIRYPAPPGPGTIGNAFFQDVLPVATIDRIPRGLLPFPPLPAVLLLPFVAIWGLATDDQTIFTLLAALDVAICWWMLGRVRVRTPVRLGVTIFFGFGTVFWYTAQIATTWYQAHIVAVGLTMLAIGVALGADVHADDEAREAGGHGPPPPPSAGFSFAVDRRQFLAGFLFGLACTARLPVAFGAPFFAFVGPGGSWLRRGWSAGLGAAIPIGLLLAYNVATTGRVFHPAYDYLYGLEARAYQGLGYEPSWALEDPRYLPQNAAIMLLTPPDILPARLPDALGINEQPVCEDPEGARGLFDVTCPLAVPRDIGMSVLLTSPAYLLLIPALRRLGRSRLVTGGTLAIVAISIVNLMHFSQGWVQFGYRFSNDAAPFALLLVAVGFERLAAGGRRWAMPLGMGLIVASIVVNLWGVAWGRLLGW